MTRSAHRFRFAGEAGEGELELDVASSRKAIRVLRLAVSDTVSIVDDTGAEYEAEITAIARGRVTIRRGVKLRDEMARAPSTAHAIESSADDTAPPAGFIVALAIIKPDRMDWAIEKIGETSANGILPFVAERSSIKTVSESRLERWKRIAVSAALQSGRGRECAIFDPAPDLAAVLSRAKRAWYLDPNTSPLFSLVDHPLPDFVLVGPEGGWSDPEMILLQSSGRGVSIGPTTLRSESAALIAALIPSLLVSNA